MSCNTSGGLLIFYYIKIGANIIFIITPIILLIMCSFDLFNAVMGNYKGGDALSKAWSKIVKRVIIAVIILMLPMLINSILSITNIGNYDECFNKATKSNIEALEREEKIKKEMELEEQKKTLAEKIKELNRKAIESAEEQIRIAKERIRNELHPNNNGENGSVNFSGGASGSVANALNIPYYNQCDNRWGNITYDTGGATLCSSSCGYTSLAMVASGLSRNSSINPYTIIKDIRGIKDGGMTSRGYGAASTHELTSSKYLSKYGIKAAEVGRSGIMASLRNGNPVIALVPGHYITLSKSSNGNIVVLDPFTNWANKAKGCGEFSSLAQIESAYGAISWAASYRRG